MKQTLFLIIIGLFVFSACKNTNKPQKILKPILSVNDPPNRTIITFTNDQDKDIDTDTIRYDSFKYPSDSIYSARLLTTGTFHSDEVWENAENGKWFGLFRNNSGFYLEETTLKTTRVKDEIVDETEDNKTGWSVQTTNKDLSLFLVEGLDFLTNLKTVQAILKIGQILPGDTLQFNFLGIDYILYATGGKKQDKYHDDELFIWNYKLFLSANKNDKLITELLVAQPNFDDGMINIIFAGDIDGDGLLDLLIDTSRHYNVSIATLYLSKPTDKNHLLKVVGLHRSVGC